MKRRFQFRLERVRRVRDIQERVARAERARAESLARAAETSRDEARDVLEQSRARLRAILAGSIEPAAVLHSQRALDAELAQLRRRVESARTQRIQAERMASAHRTRESALRALEELKDRSRQRHVGELEKRDNAELDEVASQRSARAAQGERHAARGHTTSWKQEGASRSDPSAADHGRTPERPS